MTHDTIQTFPGGQTYPADPESGNPAGYVREPDTLATGGFLPPDTPGADGATGKTPGALLAEDWDSRKHSSGGIAFTRGPWQIIEHKTSGVQLYRRGEVHSVGFRSVEAAIQYVARIGGSK